VSKKRAAIVFCIFLVAAFSLLAGAPPTLGDAEATIVLQQGNNGYLGARDTYIYKYAPQTNFANAEPLIIGYKEQYALLMQFDLTPLPSNAVVTRAVLEIYATGWSGQGLNVTIDAYRLLREVRVGQATWEVALQGSPWGAPGCNAPTVDRAAAPESSVSTSGIEKWYSFDLTSLVGAWSEGSVANSGIMLRTRFPDLGRTFRFAGAQSGSPALRPRLVINYQAAGDVTPVLPSTTPSSTATRTPTASPTVGNATATSLPASSPTPTASQTTTSVPYVPPPSGGETTVTLQQGLNGYTGWADTYIYKYAPNSNYAAIEPLRIGYKEQYAILLRVDLASIPANACINRAVLQFYAIGWSGPGQSVFLDLYRLLREVKIGQATWSSAQQGIPWGLAGCSDTTVDRVAAPDCSVPTSGIEEWYSFDITALAQAWSSGSAANNGVLVRTRLPDNGRSFRFSGAQSPTVALRPKLVVTYQVDGPVPADTTTPTPTRTQTLPAVGATATATPLATSTTTPVLPAPGADTTLILQQGVNGYSGCTDTYTFQRAPGSNYCWDSWLRVGYGQQNAGILRFDLSSIPWNATISSASLQLYATGWSCTTTIPAVHALLRPVSACQVTWNEARAGDPWARPGANDTIIDRRATVEGSVTANGVAQWYAFDIRRVVQEWVSSSLPNNGLLLRDTLTYSPATFYFASAQATDIHFRPKLVISYHTRPTPTPAAVPTLIIGHITDSHMREGPGFSETFVNVIRTIGSQAQVLVDSGDCTEDGNAAQSIHYYDLINGNAYVPWRAVPGNHDTPDTFVRYIGPLQWSLDIGNYRLIGIEAESIDYAALDQALTLDKTCVIIGHFPLDVYPWADQEKLRERFRNFRVPIYLAGHTHEDSYSIDLSTGTILLVGKRVGYGHYRLITLQGRAVLNVAYQYQY